MPIYKDDKKGTWFVVLRYNDFTGKKWDKQQKEDLKPKEMQKFMKAILYLIKQKI